MRGKAKTNKQTNKTGEEKKKRKKKRPKRGKLTLTLNAIRTLQRTIFSRGNITPQADFSLPLFGGSIRRQLDAV